MSPSSQWRRLLRLPRSDIRAAVDDEIEAHLALLTADHVARGLSPADARALAERDFGAIARVRDECVAIERRRRRRANLSEHVMSILQDIRYAARTLRTNALFSIAAILCTALGVATTATIFSAVHATLIRPLPFDKPDELVAVYGAIPKQNVTGANISWPDFVDWRDANRTFQALGMWTWSSPSFTGAGAGGAERVEGAEVSPNLFGLLGVRPMLGRTFLESEGKAGNDRVVILSYGLWQRRFASDRDIVGKAVTVDLQPYTVVGVMPRGFAFPDRGQAWVPFVPNKYEAHGNRGYAGAIGRLKSGMTVDAAQRDLDVIMQRLERELPRENEGWRANVITLREDLVGNLRRPLEVFAGAVILLLLIACANVANLTLTRGAARQRELAVRTALGAGRGRIVRQLITESLVLSVSGGLLGAAMTVYGVRLLLLGFPDDVPYYAPIAVNVPTLLFAAFVSIVAGLAFGLIPAFRVTGGSLDRALREGGRGTSDGVARGRGRSAIVVGELALSVMLMIGAGLLVKSYRSIASTTLGFESKGILSFRITLPAAKYATAEKRLAFYEELERRLGALPGAASVGLAQGIPFSGWNVQAGAMREGWPQPKPGQEFVTHYQVTSPGYFSTIGVPIVRGRGLQESDRDTVNVMGLINETFARRAFPNEDPVGKRVRLGDANSTSPWVTIVGVVHDYRHYRLPQPVGPALYLPQTSWAPGTQTIALRVRAGDPSAMMTSARRVLREMDPDMAPYRIVTFEQAVAASLWRQRFQGFVVAVFAALAMLLAAVGIYGVISYSVAQRKRELGVRVALGAQAGDIVGLVMRGGATLAAIGVVLGLVGGMALTRFLTALLYEVKPRDPAVFAGVALGLGAVALLAVAVPAWRATRADPLEAMRPD
ncbi:MAG TPA: ABC transporter permease [Gemmatimonadaceae bacterium]|nr:ABC transporter permease [Gemmatimonadaceae bacterium]